LIFQANYQILTFLRFLAGFPLFLSAPYATNAARELKRVCFGKLALIRHGQADSADDVAITAQSPLATKESQKWDRFSTHEINGNISVSTIAHSDNDAMDERISYVSGAPFELLNVILYASLLLHPSRFASKVLR